MISIASLIRVLRDRSKRRVACGLPAHAEFPRFLLAFLVLAAPAGAQTLANPGFESPYNSIALPNITGQVASGWSDNTDWAGGVQIQYSRDTVVRHGGASSQRIRVDAGFAQFVQWMTFQAGRTDASIWMRANSPMWVSLYLRGTGYVTYAAQTVRLTPEWQLVTVSGITPADPEGGLFVNSANTGTFWLDDASLTFLGSAPLAPVALTPPTREIPLGYFAMHPSHTFYEPFLPWPNATFGVARTHDCGPKWADIEPNAPVNGVRAFNWTILDQFVQEAESRGVRVVYTVYQTPSWAATSQVEDPYGQPGGNSPPAQVELYEGFVNAVATRYRGRIFAYEAWNEPDISFWTGTPAQMAALDAACARAVRAADPAALVVAPPPSGSESYLSQADWYERFLIAGGAANADVIACHFYSAKAESDIQKAATFRSLLALYGQQNKPLWHSEAGIGYDGSGSMADAVAQVARGYIIDWAIGFDLFAWYQWNEVSLVGVRRDGNNQWTELTPAAIAFREVQNWLTCSRMVSLTSNAQGVWSATIRYRNGGESIILWSPASAQSVPAPSGAFRVRDLAGGAVSVSGPTNIAIGPQPIIIDLVGGLPPKSVAPCSLWALGDLNCDGFVTVGDIGPFVTAVVTPAAYAAAFPDCNILNGDTDGNGFVTVGDIGGFVALLID